MKVSVCITTYNHEKYIAQAIDGVFMQKTSFDFEIIIGEDDSSDNTRRIVKEYKKKYPDRMQLFLNDRKNVIYIDGVPTGRWNFINNLKHARGEYIALLDGDDYWTSPYKLQRQVEFMDSHSDYAICFHPVEVVCEHNMKYPFKPQSAPAGNDTFELDDLIFYGNFIATCSVVFRRGLFGTMPDWFEEVPYGDWPLHMLNAQYGKIGYINELMGMYRVHSGGIWSASDMLTKRKNGIEMYKIVGKHLALRKKPLFRKVLSLNLLRLVNEYEACGYLSRASQAAFEGFLYYPFDRKASGLKAVIRLNYPKLNKVLKFIRQKTMPASGI